MFLPRASTFFIELLPAAFPQFQKVVFLRVVGRGGEKLVLRDVRPVAKSLDIDWYGLHGFRRGIASNLYELGADEKIVQRVLRHAKSHCYG
jgi:integrase